MDKIGYKDLVKLLNTKAIIETRLPDETDIPDEDLFPDSLETGEPVRTGSGRDTGPREHDPLDIGYTDLELGKKSEDSDSEGEYPDDDEDRARKGAKERQAKHLFEPPSSETAEVEDPKTGKKERVTVATGLGRDIAGIRVSGSSRVEQPPEDSLAIDFDSEPDIETERRPVVDLHAVDTEPGTFSAKAIGVDKRAALKDLVLGKFRSLHPRTEAPPVSATAIGPESPESIKDLDKALAYLAAGGSGQKLSPEMQAAHREHLSKLDSDRGHEDQK